MEDRRLKTKKVLVTGSGGLIGSQAAEFFTKKGFKVTGIDNDARKNFFGPSASVAWNIRRLQKEVKGYRHFSFDIRDESRIKKLFLDNSFDLVVHAAAQPSHDWAAREPKADFSINAHATLILLEQFKRYASRGVFIFVSTNKIYGDRPNQLPLVEYAKRFDLKKNQPLYNGIDERMSVDQSKHSLFGVSKLAADLLVQEYGRYFGLKTVCFRLGCVTGPSHSGTMMHGFLSYLVRCVAQGKSYTIFGYKGKQVRDHMHAVDLVNAMYHFYCHPKRGEVYNMGGGRRSNFSVLEAIESVESLLKKKARVCYAPEHRPGDHQWYITDMSKFKNDYPRWQPTYSAEAILEEMCCSGQARRRNEKL